MLSLLIPLYNEADILEFSVEKLLSYLRSRALDAEIILLDNGSKDGTEKIAEKLSAEHAEVRAVSLTERGPGRAFSQGLREARADIVLTLDADLSSDLQFIENAFRLMDAADIVVGSKSLGNQRRTPLRIFASQLYIFFAQTAFGLHLSDYSIGCKCFRRSKISPALDHLDPWTGFVLELCIFARLQGLHLVQVGIDCEDYRRSHFSLMHEGFYRFRHLFRCWRTWQDKRSWFQQVLVKEC